MHIDTVTHTTAPKLSEEFDRQIHTLIERGYADAAGLINEQFTSRIEPLKQYLAALPGGSADIAEGRLPFVIVVTAALVPLEKMVRLATWGGNPVFVNLDPNGINDYHPSDEVKLPTGDAYLLTVVDRGRATLNAPPAEALKTLKSWQRSPLTIEEGIAILTQHPEFLLKNNCFSLLGSRCGDRTVPALWISERRPRLGWCWEGAPHTWLGSASCRARLGSAP